jgi:O-antigen/teichoic acid export membrane protein
MSDVAATAFLAAASAHAGFQATVTTVVYPTLSHVRAAHWRQAHDRHTRELRPLVAVAYLAIAATGVWWLADDWSILPVVAVVLALLAMGVTAVLAAPLHRRLVKRDDGTVARLLAVDRWRTVLAFAAVAVTIAALAT